MQISLSILPPVFATGQGGKALPPDLYSGSGISYSQSMKNFKYTNDDVAWLEPMDYQGFWVAIAPYNLVLQDRGHCDDQIARGLVDEATVLNVLKAMARMELAKRHELRWKSAIPWLKVVK